MALLEFLAQSRGRMGVSQLARKIGIPKSSTHCLLLTLERSGYLERNQERGHYMFSPKLLALANVPLRHLAVSEIATPYLFPLMQDTHLAVHLAIQEQGEAVLIQKVEPTGVPKMATWIGKRLEIHCTAIGKALIAFLSDDDLERLTLQHPLIRHNDNTIVSLRKLKEDLKNVRRTGSSLDDEEEEVGVRCVGAPIFDEANHVIAAISAAGKTSQVTAENVSSIAQKVVDTAKRISRHFSRSLSPVNGTAAEMFGPSTVECGLKRLVIGVG
jgi:DNA-binding IclR family transcriptional regulator